MKIQQVAGRLWVFADDARPRPELALAGPFHDRIAAAWWIVEKLEQGMAPEQEKQWGKSLALAGGIDANPFQLIGLLLFIRHGHSSQYVDTCSPPVRDERGQLWRTENVVPQYPVEAS